MEDFIAGVVPVTTSKPEPPPVSKSPELETTGPKDHGTLTKDYIMPDDEECYLKEREQLHDVATGSVLNSGVLFNELDKDGDGKIA